MQFLVNVIQVKGKIGVYGGSIGGIAATHILKKFPNIIKVFIGDRTMGNFDNIIRNHFVGCNDNIMRIYNMVTFKWPCDNCDGILDIPTCYKIIASDEADDVVNIHDSLHHGIANKLAAVDY